MSSPAADSVFDELPCLKITEEAASWTSNLNFIAEEVLVNKAHLANKTYIEDERENAQRIDLEVSKQEATLRKIQFDDTVDGEGGRGRRKTL